MKQQNNDKHNNTSSLFSIVIPTYNEEKYIEKLIYRILEFNTDGFEIELIIIDNGSQDNTVKIAQRCQCSIFIMPYATIAQMRNYGANKAQGQWIGFIDADCMPDPDWAKTAHRLLESQPTFGVVGSFYATNTNATWVERLWHSMRHSSTGEVNFLPAGNMAVRKKEFLNINGFPENLVTGEDYGLCQKYLEKGLLVINNPMLKSVHYGNSHTLLDILKKERWYGKSYKQPILNNLRQKDFFATIFFIVGILLTIISIPMYFIADSLISIIALFIGLMLFSATNLIYAVIATIRSTKIIFLPGFIAIFFFYFTGRSLSIYDIITKNN